MLDMSTGKNQHPDEETLARFLGYFSLEILAAYQNHADRYVVETDNFEGHITLSDQFAEQVAEGGRRAEEAIDVMFGYRTLRNGDLAVAAFLPDLAGKSKGHVKRWMGFSLDKPDWSEESDERFDRWVQRYLEGSWDVENGPRFHVEDVITTINALTSETLGLPLFNVAEDRVPNFPLGQNSHRFQDAHKELYGYLIDGLNKECIAKIAARSGATINVSSLRAVNALKKAVTLPVDSPLWAVYARISEQRGLSAHGTRGPAIPFPAFEEFDQDLQAAVSALKDLLRCLESQLGAEAESARARHESRNYMPSIDRPAAANYSICRIDEAVGKTVERVEYGFRKSIEGVHESEAILLHFSDGSVLGIDTGSNAGNVADEGNGLKPEDFHVDFHLQWLRSLKLPPKTDA